MKNSNLNNEYQLAEIDLIQILRSMYSSKKIIILITLASALLAFIYLAQKEVQYQSSVTIEVGSYDLINGDKGLVEPVYTLIKKLKANEISKQLNKLNLNSIEGQFLEIKFISPSPEFNENLINETIIFSQEIHAEILGDMMNSISKQIDVVSYESEFLLGILKDYKLDLKLININELVPLAQINISRSSIEDQKELFRLNQKNSDLEWQLRFLDDQRNTTQPINDIVTSEIKPKQLLNILIGASLGFIFSIFIVFIMFIRRAFLIEQN